MVSIVTKFIVIYNDIVAVSGPYTDLRCESFPQCHASDRYLIGTRPTETIPVRVVSDI